MTGYGTAVQGFVRRWRFERTCLTQSSRAAENNNLLCCSAALREILWCSVSPSLLPLSVLFPDRQRIRRSRRRIGRRTPRGARSDRGSANMRSAARGVRPWKERIASAARTSPVSAAAPCPQLSGPGLAAGMWIRAVANRLCDVSGRHGASPAGSAARPVRSPAAGAADVRARDRETGGLPCATEKPVSPAHRGARPGPLANASRTHLAEIDR
jgi:hypothetical protein